MAKRALPIAYYVHGHGRGHASRALSLIPALRAAGHQVEVFASGEAVAALHSLGPVHERALVRPGAQALVELVRSALRERAALASSDTALLVSDGDQGALLAARLLHIPSIAIGHDLVFSRCTLPPGLSQRRLLHQRLNALISARLSTRRIAVHFLPIGTRDVRTRVARVEVDASDLREQERADTVVCYFRDTNAARIIEIAQAVAPNVVTFGKGSAQAPVSRDAFRHLLGTARAAIGSAGSNLIAECVMFKTPLLALYEADDAEQALNAQLLEASGLGAACSFDQVTHETVRAFWEGAQAGCFGAIDLNEALPSIVHELLSTIDELFAPARARRPRQQRKAPEITGSDHSVLQACRETAARSRSRAFCALHHPAEAQRP